MTKWQPLIALALSCFPIIFIGGAGLFLAFPDRLHRHAVLGCLSLAAIAAFLTSRRLIPDWEVEDVYLRFLIIFLAHIWFLAGLEPEARMVATKVGDNLEQGKHMC